MSDIPFPIIRMELQGFKHAMLVALTQQEAKIDLDIREALEQFCKPENIRQVIHQQIRTGVEAAIRAEVENLFKYGDGRKAISEALKEAMKGSWLKTINHAIKEELIDRLNLD